MHEYQNDIEKYLNGTLTSAERHRLEKRALSDPFLAEALEGAEALSNVEFSHDLNHIHQKINSQKRNSFFWPLRVAAAILVVVSIAIVTIKLSETDTNNHLALQKQKSDTDSPASADTAPVDLAKESKDSSSPAEQPAQLGGALKETQETQAMRNQPAIAEKSPSAQPLPMASSEAPPSQTEQARGESDAMTEMADEKIIEQKYALPKAASSEEDEKAMLSQPSYSNRAEGAAAPMQARELRKKVASESAASISKDDAPSVIMTPEPYGGMLLFNKYIQDNLRYPQRALTNSVEGDVSIEFQIYANGSYQDFVIVKSVGYGCDEEAIRLIKEGPKWNPAIQDGKVIDNKPRITIPFRIKKTGN